LGNRFSKGESGNPDGRRKSIYTVLYKSGYSVQDIRTCITEMMFYTLDQLKEVIENGEGEPLIKLAIAKQWRKVLQNDGDFSDLDKMLKYALPKADAAVFANMNLEPKEEVEDAVIIELPMDKLKERKLKISANES
jgi:hypothetical protein